MVFGVFDGLHKGHKFFLREAKKLGGHLIVVVTPDEVALKIKGKFPKENVDKRISLIMTENLADEIVLGDSVLGSWKVLEDYRPDIIALGYDQKNLASGLEDYYKKTSPRIETKFIPSFNPGKFKSALLNNESRSAFSEPAP